MRILRTKINIFTVILTMAVIASSLQLDFLRGGISEVADYLWVQGNLMSKQNETCINCGTETTVAASPVRTFEPDRIVISSVNIDLPVVSVPLRNGSWKVYSKVANFAEGTSLVNEKTGNVGIYAHARPDAFGNIKSIKEGEKITIYGQTYRAIYVVTTITTIEPTAVDVFYPQNEPMITLITCDGPADEKRYMVRAKLSKIERLHEVLTMVEK